MTDCVNTYLIDRHLREQEDREAHEMRFVEATDAYACRHCGEMHITSSEAGACCGGDATAGGAYVENAYICTHCERISEDLDDIKGHDHD